MSVTHADARIRLTRPALLRASAALLATTCWALPAQAQTAPDQSLVDVCTGIRLPRSAITSTMTPVLQGIVTPLQGTVNSLITNILTPKLNINLSALLANAAAGDPIALEAVTRDGTLLGPSDACNLQADRYSLETAGGISIGGNSISGLGGSALAVSGEINSISLGNGAVTAANALGAIAIGTGAQVGSGASGAVALGQGANVLVAGGVALGANAVVTRGPQGAYAAYGLAGSFASAGSVSIGSSGAERQIVNLAPGSEDTDAVNVAQLGAVASRLSILNSHALQYDDLLYGTISLAGPGGTRISNLLAGDVSASSTDAINGSQLHQTNGVVAGNTSAITDLTGRMADYGGRIASQEAKLTAGQATLLANSAALQALRSSALQYDDPLYRTISLAGAGGTRISNLLAGDVSTGSSDAINGSQLHQTNVLVAGNADAITDMTGRVADHGSRLTTQEAGLAATQAGVLASNAAIQALNSAALQYDDTLYRTISLAGSGGTRISNLLAGDVNAASTDAINGSQLHQTNGVVAGNTSAITDLSGRVADHGGRLTTQEAGLAATQAGVLASNVAIQALDSAALQYDDPSHGTISLAGPDGTRIRNTLAGDVSATSSDAVNGSQLHQTNGLIAGNASAITNLTGRVADNSGRLTAQATELSAARADVLANSTLIANLTSSLANGASGPVRYSDPLAPSIPNGGAPTQAVTLIGGGAGPVGLHNVADGTIGATSSEAINGSQLFSTNSAVGRNVASLTELRTGFDEHDAALGRMASSMDANAAAIVTVDAAIDRVDGRVAGLGATLDMQGAQLRDQSGHLSTIAADLASAIAGVTSADQAIGNLKLEMSRGLLGPLRYADGTTPLVPNSGTITNNLVLVGASGGPVVLHNVAPGQIGNGSLDAVNAGQLYGLGAQIATGLGLGSYDPSQGFSGSFLFRGSAYSDVQSVFGAIEGTLANISTTTTTTNNGGGSPLKYFNTNSVMADSSATGIDSVATGPSAVASGEASVASGRNARADTLGSVAIGNDAVATGGKSVSIGTSNVASGDGAVAIGDPNFATGLGAIALGRDNTVSGDGAVALGDTNSITGNGALALGLQNVGSGNGTTVLGSRNAADGEGAIAVGDYNQVSGARSLAIGGNNTVSGNGSLAIGNDIVSTNNDALAIGSSTRVGSASATAIGNRAVASAAQSLALGNDAQAGAEQSSAFGTRASASGVHATALGARASANGSYSTAVGRNAAAEGFSTASFGLMSSSTGYAATALGSGAAAEHEGSVALGTAARTVRGPVDSYVAFGVTDLQSSGGEIAIGRNTSFYDPFTSRYTIVGPRQITGLAAGSEDTDAVNVAQLKGLAGSLGTAFAESLGGGARYDGATGTVSGPAYSVNGTSYANVSAALGALVSQFASVPQQPSSPAPQGGGSAADPQLVAQVQALGAQLATLQAQLAALQALANGAPAAERAPAAASALHYESDGSVVLAAGADAGGTRIANVAAGAVEQDSQEAVNGGQLYATNRAVVVAQSTADAALALGQDTIRYDDAARTSVTLAPGSEPVRIRNVAAGVESTDAASVGQLNAALGQVLADAGAYTDGKVAALGFDLEQASRKASGGISGAMAVASMPQPYEAGRSMLAMGVGTHGGEQAISLGFAATGTGGHLVGKAGVVYQSTGHVSASAGMGWQF